MYKGEREWKPHGLWVSVEGEYDWKSWCEAENFNLDSLSRVYEVHLQKDAKILMIDGLAHLDAFHKNQKYRRDEKTALGSFELYHIDWSLLRRDYHGIIIAPYQWKRRLEYMWYYSWDCASGCIWNMKAIDFVLEVERDKEKVVAIA